MRLWTGPWGSEQMENEENLILFPARKITDRSYGELYVTETTAEWVVGYWSLSESLWLSQFHFTTSEVSQHFSSPPQHPHIPQLPLLSDTHPVLGMWFDCFKGPLHMVPFSLILLPHISVLYWWKSPSGLHYTSSPDKTAFLPAYSLPKFMAMRCWSSALLQAQQE